ncbi:hypothetical protein [Deinococcus marmoris]|uniref:hypothetical protein n=1 Tax=Deinococcus marmoris TaxID=249408 RepID=UPI00111542E9
MGDIYPLKSNSRYDTGWRPDRQPKFRERMAMVFSQLVAEGIRFVQTQTLASLRLRVALAVIAHNLPRP